MTVKRVFATLGLSGLMLAALASPAHASGSMACSPVPVNNGGYISCYGGASNDRARVSVNCMNPVGSTRTLNSAWIYSSGVASVYCSPDGYEKTSYYYTIQWGDGTSYTSPLF